MSRPIFGSISLKNQSFAEFFDSTNTKSVQLLAPSSVGTSSVLTLPVVAADTIVARTTTDTLTNKTLTAPVISTITNTGTLTLPTSTDTLVGRATTDTLTNKTLGATNTIQLASATLTGTVPLLNGGTGTAATSANQAFNALSPMTAAGDLIYGGTAGAGTRLAVGSTGNVLTVSGGVPTWAPPASTVTTYKTTWTTSGGTSLVVTHNLGTTDVMIQIYDITSGQTIEIDSAVRTSTTQVTLTASSAPPAGSWRVLILAQ